MAVDILHNRQMACKVVTLNKSTQGWSRQANFSGTFWREVDLLKDISHVRKETPFLTALTIFQPNILRVERVFFTNEKLYDGALGTIDLELTSCQLYYFRPYHRR